MPKVSECRPDFESQGAVGEPNLLKESLILFSDTPKHLPKRGNKAVHLSACYRWKNQGIAGVRLETVYVAGNRWTSLEAIERFWRRVTEAKDGRKSRPTASRLTAASKASNELKEAGW